MPAITSIQAGSATFPATQTTFDVTITSVDTGKTLVGYTSVGNSGSSSGSLANYCCSCELINSTTIRFTKNLDNPTLTFGIEWTAIEFTAGAVQRGRTGITSTPQSIAITQVDPARSIIYSSFDSDVNLTYEEETGHTTALDGTGENLVVESQAAPGAGDVNLVWQVYEAPVGSIEVQTATLTIATAQTVQTGAITAVDLAKTFLTKSGLRVNGAVSSHRAHNRARLTAVDEIEIARSSADTPTGVGVVQVVECLDDTAVESGLVSIANASTTPASQPTLSGELAAGSLIASFGAPGNQRHVGGNAENRNVWASQKLDTPPDSLTITRAGTGGQLDVAWFAVDWAGGGAPIEETLSFGLTATDAAVAEAALASSVSTQADLDDAVAEVVASTVSLTETAAFDDATASETEGGTGPTPVADVNTDAGLDVDTTYLIRVRVKNTGSVAGATDFRWSYNHAVAGWLPITTTSTEIKAVAASTFVNDDDVPEIIGGLDPYQADNNAGSEDGTTTLGAPLLAGSAAEFVLAFQIVGADVSNAETGQIRLELGDGTDFDLYTNTFTYTVFVEAVVETLSFGLVAGEADVALAALAADAPAGVLEADTAQTAISVLSDARNEPLAVGDAVAAITAASETTTAAGVFDDTAVGDTGTESEIVAAVDLAGAQEAIAAVSEATTADVSGQDSASAAAALMEVISASGVFDDAANGDTAGTVDIVAAAAFAESSASAIDGIETLSVGAALDDAEAANAELMDALTATAFLASSTQGDTASSRSVSFAIDLEAAPAATVARVAAIAEPMVAAVAAAEVADFAAIQAEPIVVQIATENAVAGFADLAAGVDVGSAQSSLVDLVMLLDVNAAFGVVAGSELGTHNTVTLELALASIMESTPRYIDPILGARFGVTNLAAKHVGTDVNLTARFQY